MKIAVFSTKKYDQEFLTKANKSHSFELTFFADRLNEKTALLAKGFDIVCVFVNDIVDRVTLDKLSEAGIKGIALRCAGFNNVDLVHAKKLNIQVTNVPRYSPYSVAEHAIALMLTLNRKTQRAYNRDREGNFSIEGLMGFDMHGKTVGIIGLGRIGQQTAVIAKGFGCKVLSFDTRVAKDDAKPSDVLATDLSTLLSSSDIISLHCPLTPETTHIINKQTIDMMKDGVMIINTSRGGLIDTREITEALKSGKIGYLGLDVYEEEENLFFQDLSTEVLLDDLFARLLTFPNVVITSHQAFFTKEAVVTITETTLNNISQMESQNCPNELTASLQ